ncbi:MAG TPA: FAD-dependent oxidoreductase, partial [Clostridia bacterium]|nr:FAD-dependent oxidoreductase [Clostridia bacterium]
MNIVIIGSGAASKSAIDTILSADRIDIDITVITRDTNYFYSRVLLPNYIAGEISMEDLSFVDKSFIESKRLKIVRGTVISLDTQLKRVFVDKFGSIKYDKLIITSGASAIKLKNVKAGLGGIFDLRDFEDAVAIKDKAEQSSNCILIGGGLVALKTAAAIKKLDKDVTILVESERVLSRVMDKYSSELVKQLFEENGIKIVLNAK